MEDWVLTNGTSGMDYKIMRIVPYPQVSLDKLSKSRRIWSIIALKPFFQVKFVQLYFENNFVLLEIQRLPDTREVLYPTCISAEPLSSNATCRHEIALPTGGKWNKIAITRHLLKYFLTLSESKNNNTESQSYEIFDQERCNATFSGLLASDVSSICLAPQNNTSCSVSRRL